MKSKTINKVIVGIMSIVLVTGMVPVSAAPKEDQKGVVNGTYSTGASNYWTDLDKVMIGRDTGQVADATIVVDPSIKYQEYQGMGISLDETGISNLWKLSEGERRKAIQMIVDPVNGAGIELFRIPIGSADCIEHIPFWSYDELPNGVDTDFDLNYFSIQKDIDYHIIDVIKLIQEYNPNAQFYGSAWSAPAWMTSTNTFTGVAEPKNDGSGGYYQASKLRDDCINVFARYYTKFIQAYANQGITIGAITMLNEPGMDVVYPAMDISIEQQQKLALEIKKEFEAAGLSTKLWMHDFNFWDWKDPASTETKNYYRVYEDSADGKIKGQQVLDATDAIAFHPYWGNSSVMKDAALAYKGKEIHMTETNIFDSGTIINYFNDYANSYCGWTTITDQNGGTLHWTDARNNNIDWNTVNPAWRNRLVVTNHNTGTTSYTNNFYAWGQFAKYLDQGFGERDGAVRVFSTTGTQKNISNVTFRNPDGEMVMVLRNSSNAQRTVKVNLMDKTFIQTIPASSTATLHWYPELPTATDNVAPVLNKIDNVVMDQNTTKKIKLSATDADGDKLMYYGLDLPAGVTVDSKTGVVTLTPVAAGEATLTFVASDGNAQDQKTMILTVNKKAAAVVQHVEAEDYKNYGNFAEGFVENKSNASGGKSIGSTLPGVWVGYDVSVPAAGTYDITFCVANGRVDAFNYFNVQNSSGVELVKVTIPVNSSGVSWDNFFDVTIKGVSLEAGDQYLKILSNNWGWNFDYFEIIKENAGSGVDKTAIGQSIDVAEAAKLTISKNLLPSARKAFDNALEVAYTVFNDDKDLYSQDAVNKANAELRAATDNLDLIVDLDNLDSAIANAEAKAASGKYYDNAAMTAYKAELSKAKALRAKDVFTNKEIKQIVDALVAAEAQLNLIPQKSALNDLIKLAKKLDVAKFTTNSAAVFTKALNAAVNVYGSDTADQKAVDSVFTELINAIGDLVLIPENLKVTLSSVMKKSPTSLALKWNKVEKASGYEIFRSSSQNGTYKIVKTITSGNTTSYIDSKLKSGTKYYYQIRVYQIEKGKKLYSSYSNKQSQITALTKVTLNKIGAKSVGNKKLTLSWKKVTGASGYEIYRSTKKNGKYKKVATLKGVKKVKFTNKKLKSRVKYYYKIRAYRTVAGKKVYGAYSKTQSARAK